MSQQIFRDAKLWVAGYDFSADVNALALKYMADTVENTPLGTATRTRLPGLRSYSFSHAGFWDGGAGLSDDAIFNSAFAVRNTVMSIDGQGLGVEGDVAYAGQVDVAAYVPGAKVGQMLGFTLAGQSDGDELVRGTLAANRVVTATGNGAIFQLGAVGAAQKIYAALHALAPIAGTTPTLTVALQSAALVGFGSPTTRITFTQVTTTIGAQWAKLAGSITDQFWRFTWTLTGTTPSYPIVCVAGIK